MNNDTATPTAGRWLRYLGAAALLSAAFIGFSLWTATPPPRVAFDMTATISDREVRVGGATGVREGTFGFDGSRMSFSGAVTGDKVSIEGRFVADDRSWTKPFKGGATIVNGRATVTVKGSEGRRIGSLRLDFNPS